MTVVQCSSRFLVVTRLSAFWLSLSLTAAQQPSHLYEKCYGTSDNTTRCYSLYGDPLTHVPWHIASRRCSADNRTMAIIGDENTERRIEGFLRRAAGLSSAGVWIGGRRSDDNTWKYLHSGKTAWLSGNYPSECYCAKRSKLNSNPQSVSCTEKHLPLCQYNTKAPTATNEGCDGGVLYSKGLCLSSGLYPVTWFEARNYCRSKYQDGDLMTITGDVSVLNKTLPSDTGCGYWIGLERRPWMWITENEQTAIVYYDFNHGEGSDQSQSCLYLKVTTDGDVYWADMFCNQSLNYYLCEMEFQVYDSSVQSQLSINMSIVHIIIIATLAVAIIVLAVLVFIFIKRRRQTRTAKEERLSRESKPEQNASKSRLTISEPLPMEAPPFPVSGYDNLGTLVPVKPEKDGQDMMAVRAEMAIDGSVGDKEIQC